MTREFTGGRGEVTAVDARARAKVAPARVIEAFPWQGLPRLSRAAVLAARGLPPLALRRLCEGLAADWGHDLGASLSVQLRSVGAARASPTLGCHAALWLAAPALPASLSLDRAFAAALLHRLAGGEGAAPPSAGPLGEVERGVLSYLALRAVACLDAEPWGARLAPRLVSVDVVAPPLLDEAGLIMALFEVDACFARGTLALTVPAAAFSGAAPVEGAQALRPGAALGAAPVVARVELARAAVAARELAALAPGDVVVCAGPAGPGVPASPAAPGTLRGHLRVLGGRWVAGVEAAPVDGHWALTLGSAYPSEENPMHDTAPGAALAADAPLTVTVELGRLTLRVEELTALQCGDTLLLGRPPGALLDLVAAGRVLARGELVDVEGELGLRVLSLG